MLEHFFDENPFPTHADKESLAKKSGMTYRQIHVWVSGEMRKNLTICNPRFSSRTAEIA